MTNPKEISKQSEEIRERILKPAIAGSDLSAVEQACSIWRSAVDAERLEQQKRDLIESARSRKLKFWTALLALATLLFEIHQFNENRRLQLRAEETAEWRETLKTMQSPEMLQGIQGAVLLKSLFDSEAHKAKARELAFRLVSGRGTMNLDVFRILFPAALEGPAGEDFARAVKISRALANNYDQYTRDIQRICTELRKEYKVCTDENNLPRRRYIAPMMMVPPDVAPEDEILFLSTLQRDTEDELKLVAKHLAGMLRERRPNQKVDLADVSLWFTDLSGINFNGVALDNAEIYGCNVANATFQDVTRFRGSIWKNTPWWRAERMNPELLRYLKNEFPFDNNTQYYQDTTPEQAEYLREVTRLEKIAQ